MFSSRFASPRRLIGSLLQAARPRESVHVTSHRGDPAAWLNRHLPAGWFRPPPAPGESTIERLAAETQALGAQPLWMGYQQAYTNDEAVAPDRRRSTRTSDDVRTTRIVGRFFSWLVTARRPRSIAEVG